MAQPKVPSFNTFTFSLLSGRRLLGRFHCNAHAHAHGVCFSSSPRRPPSPKKRGEDSSRGRRSVPGSSAPPALENVRRGQARGRGRRAGGAPGLLRGPQAGGRGVPAAGRGGAQDPAQERRYEGGDAAGGLRNRPHRVREAHHGEGHRGVHQEGVRQEPRPNLALHRRPQLRFVCNA